MRTIFALYLALLPVGAAVADSITQQVLVAPTQQPVNEWASVIWAHDASGWETQFRAADTISVTLNSDIATPRDGRRVSYLLKYRPSPAMRPWPGTLQLSFDLAISKYSAEGKAVAYVAANFSIRDTKSGERFWLNIVAFDPRAERPSRERTKCSPSKSTAAPIVSVPAAHGQSFVDLRADSAEFSHRVTPDFNTFRLSISDANMRAILVQLRSMKGWCADHGSISLSPADYEVRQGAIMMESYADKRRDPGEALNINLLLRNPSLTSSR